MNENLKKAAQEYNNNKTEIQNKAATKIQKKYKNLKSKKSIDDIYEQNEEISQTENPLNKRKDTKKEINRIY